MKIHQIRNATQIIEAGEQVILVDPMLGRKGSLPSFAFIRYKARRNPIVDLPVGIQPLLDKVTHCLITHQHMDHIDAEAEKFLRERNIPITCSALDHEAFKKKGLNVVQSLAYNQAEEFLGGKIIGTSARHGYGYIAKPMGNVMGFYIELPGMPSLYLSSDTIYTDKVAKVLIDYKPDICVVAAGSARFDLFQPLLMRMDDIIRFCHDAPGKVIANHLEAVNHCPTTREDLRKCLAEEGLSEKVAVPEDGEALHF